MPKEFVAAYIVVFAAIGAAGVYRARRSPLSKEALRWTVIISIRFLGTGLLVWSSNSGRLHLRRPLRTHLPKVLACACAQRQLLRFAYYYYYYYVHVCICQLWRAYGHVPTSRRVWEGLMSVARRCAGAVCIALFLAAVLACLSTPKDALKSKED